MKPLGECPLVYPLGFGVLESDRTGDDIFNCSLRSLGTEVEYEKISGVLESGRAASRYIRSRAASSLSICCCLGDLMSE